eukprot:9272692-Heterocapsa_arctica.AAC.1
MPVAAGDFMFYRIGLPPNACPAPDLGDVFVDRYGPMSAMEFTRHVAATLGEDDPADRGVVEYSSSTSSSSSR